MAHCSLLILWILLFEFPISKLQKINQTIATNYSLEEISQRSSFEAQQASIYQFKFLIPLTGVLLVISMVLMYLAYTWNETHTEASRKPNTANNHGSLYGQRSNPNGLNETLNELWDPPPSYMEGSD